jgi:3-hydroxyacyl-[acyl-carrier-protein] dehydratase
VLLLDECNYEGELFVSSQLQAVQGHFPGCAVVPGVFLIEGVAQLAGAAMLAGHPVARQGRPGTLGMLGAVRRSTFTDVVMPDEPVVATIQGRSIGNGMSLVGAELRQGDLKVATIDFTLVQVPLERVAARLPVDRLLAANSAILRGEAMADAA